MKGILRQRRISEDIFYMEVRRNLPEELRMLLSGFNMSICMGTLHLVRKINIPTLQNTSFLDKDENGLAYFRSGFSTDPSYCDYIRKYRAILPIKEKPCVWLGLREANLLSCYTEYSFPCDDRLTLDAAKRMAHMITAC